MSFIQILPASVQSCFDDIRLLQTEFQETGFVKLPGLFSLGLLETLEKKLDSSDCFERDLDQSGIYLGAEFYYQTPAVVSHFHFLLNDPRVIMAIRQLTGVRDLQCFLGRLYRMTGEKSHEIAWHTDLNRGREVGISINLGRQSYKGGIFEMRQRGQESLQVAFQNLGWGDAFLFRVSPEYEHRVTKIEPGPDKMAIAGWFKSTSEYSPTRLISELIGPWQI